MRSRSISCALAPLVLVAAPVIGAGSRGAVASSDARATAAGIAMLEAGGNAIDAAVATAVALAVVFPEAGNLGGGGFAVVRKGDQVEALDFREIAPAAARPGMFLDAAGEPLPGASLYGPLAAGVPGSPTGYYELHRRFGKLSWKQVVAPAIRLARDGFEISTRTARTLAERRDLIARYPEGAARFLPGGLPLGAGVRLRLPELAATLAGYAEHGPDALVSGPVAAAVERVVQSHGGVLTAADLAAYRPVWREPLRFERFGWSFAAMPLPSSGGVIVGETLGLLERLGWHQLERGSAGRTQLLIEALRRAYADRFELADPASTEVTEAQLLDPQWLDRRAAGISSAHATPSQAVRPFPAEARPEPSHTTNVSVVDGAGNAVDLTTTLNDLYGCGLWVPGIGFLNNEMDDFTTAPGRPNDYGLIQGKANEVRAGHRPLSSMSPMILTRGREVVAIGGRGGSAIPTAVIQVLLDLWQGDSAAAATARPRIHHQWLPDQVEVEHGALAGDVTQRLAALGYELAPLIHGAEVNLVHRRDDGSLDAAGDPRATEAAAVAGDHR
jgi:gamma-glutamyltranspeptidase/glutathione hydrolase